MTMIQMMHFLFGIDLDDLLYQAEQIACSLTVQLWALHEESEIEKLHYCPLDMS